MAGTLVRRVLIQAYQTESPRPGTAQITTVGGSAHRPHVASAWYAHRTASPVAVILGAGGLLAAVIGALTDAAGADPTLAKVMAVFTGVVPLVAGVIMKRVPAAFS